MESTLLFTELIGFTVLIFWSSWNIKKDLQKLQHDLKESKDFLACIINLQIDRYDDLKLELKDCTLHIESLNAKLEYLQQDIQGITSDVANVRQQITDQAKAMQHQYHSMEKHDRTLMNWNRYLKKIEKEWPKFSLVQKQYDKLKSDYRQFRKDVSLEGGRIEQLVHRCFDVMNEVGCKTKHIDDNYLKASKWVCDLARDFHKLALVFKSGEIQKIKVLNEDQYLDIRNIPNFERSKNED